MLVVNYIFTIKKRYCETGCSAFRSSMPPSYGGYYMRTILFLAIFSIIQNSSAFAGGDDIIGILNTQEKDAKIEIIHC
jgi:hypothetical protein